MKESALRILVCPGCQGALDLDRWTQEAGEVITGALRCEGCSGAYPIIGGVPRMLPRHLLADLPHDYPSFFAEHEALFAVPTAAVTDTARVQRSTQEAFGFEWTHAGDYHADNFRDWFPDGIDPRGVVEGKVGLEVGCGAGRHAAFSSMHAKEHVAVDLPRAVDTAFERNRALPNCHVVQADAFHLPFRPGTFDYVYCLGVLQHMHDPVEGFRQLARQPRPGGGVLLVNVYQASRPFLQRGLELVRKLTTRLPNSVLWPICVAAGVIEYGFFTWPWKVVKRASLGGVLKPFVPARVDEYARHDFHTSVTDWFDRLSCPVKIHYSRDDLVGWYVDAGYTDVRVTPYWKAFWNGFGQRR